MPNESHQEALTALKSLLKAPPLTFSPSLARVEHNGQKIGLQGALLLSYMLSLEPDADGYVETTLRDIALNTGLLDNEGPKTIAHLENMGIIERQLSPSQRFSLDLKALQTQLAAL